MLNTAPSTPHLFAVYIATLLEKERLTIGAALTIKSPELAHRLYTVLRLTPGELLQLFSKTHLLTVTLTPSPRPKDTVTCSVHTLTPLTPRSTHLFACIGLLKKESFEEAVHHAAVTGATHIVPLITTKSRKGWLNEREEERLQSTLIAACEQSKNYHIPQLLKPQTTEQFLKTQSNEHGIRIGFESTGKPFIQLITRLNTHRGHDVYYFVGPEGGFTQPEVTLLEQHKTEFYALTQTILRSQEAVCVAGGFISALVQDQIF